MRVLVTFLLLTIGLAAALGVWAAVGSTTEWSGRLRFTVTEVRGGVARVEWTTGRGGDTGAPPPEVTEVPVGGLGEVRAGQLIECRVEVRRRPVVGGELPGIADRCRVVG